MQRYLGALAMALTAFVFVLFFGKAFVPDPNFVYFVGVGSRQSWAITQLDVVAILFAQLFWSAGLVRELPARPS